MSTRQDGAPSGLVRSRDDLVAWIAAGEKPKPQWRIGTEHEKFVFHTDTLTPVPYEGERSISALMKALIARFGWQPIIEGGKIIALKRQDCELCGNISLEPGGQFELSGGAVETLHETAAETREHLREVLSVGEPLGIGFLGLGFSPKWTLAETPHMPKERYSIMTRYMPTVGSRGLDMMYRTATIQVNLDFADEADMVKKLRVSLALQPIATALFASSPFTEGKPQRLQVDAQRGMARHRPPRAPACCRSPSRTAWATSATSTMRSTCRCISSTATATTSTPPAPRSSDFLDGKLPQLPGERPTLDDWSDHLTTLFPEVRLKRFLEMRGADSGPWQRICALPAFWAGLLYDAQALDAAWELVKDWTAEEREALRNAVPKSALATPFRDDDRAAHRPRSAAHFPPGAARAPAHQCRQPGRGGLPRHPR